MKQSINDPLPVGSDYVRPSVYPAKYEAEKPVQSMRAFFNRADVKALQEIQKQNPFDSEAHRKATADLRQLGEAIGAGRFFQ